MNEKDSIIKDNCEIKTNHLRKVKTIYLKDIGMEVPSVDGCINYEIIRLNLKLKDSIIVAILSFLIIGITVALSTEYLTYYIDPSLNRYSGYFSVLEFNSLMFILMAIVMSWGLISFFSLQEYEEDEYLIFSIKRTSFDLYLYRIIAKFYKDNVWIREVFLLGLVVIPIGIFTGAIYLGSLVPLLFGIRDLAGILLTLIVGISIITLIVKNYHPAINYFASCITSKKFWRGVLTVIIFIMIMTACYLFLTNVSGFLNNIFDIVKGYLYGK